MYNFCPWRQARRNFEEVGFPTINKFFVDLFGIPV
jgi:hypothetical protein